MAGSREVESHFEGELSKKYHRAGHYRILTTDSIQAYGHN